MNVNKVRKISQNFELGMENREGKLLLNSTFLSAAVTVLSSKF
jgi:hypothetical protein